MKVPAGLSQIMSRISQIESRIAQINGGGPSQQALDIPNVATPFGDVLHQATRQNGLPLPIQSRLSGVAPLSPDGETIRPIELPAVAAYNSAIEQSAQKYGVDPNLVSAVIQTESSGNPRAVSRAGAMGLMQLMPSNVTEAGVTDPFDPVQNIDAGTKQLSDMLSKYNGDVDLALAAYNAGPGAVQRYGGVPPYAETQNYIRKVRGIMGSK